MSGAVPAKIAAAFTLAELAVLGSPDDLFKIVR